MVILLRLLTVLFLSKNLENPQNYPQLVQRFIKFDVGINKALFEAKIMVDFIQF